MMDAAEAWNLRSTAEPVCSAADVAAAIRRVAHEITATLSAHYPLVLTVMGGGVVFTGQLLPLLDFPLAFDYLHVPRYRDALAGGTLQWKVLPGEAVAGRVVLVLDDILDEGHTLAAIRDRIVAAGAAGFYSAVLADKDIGRAKPIAADFVGVTVPDRFVFGVGMDVKGMWRNLPAIYAVKEEGRDSESK
jgi:hypoxanthine phosphoribosyltransferase